MEKENSMDLITEFEFELPRGYLDENGELHPVPIDNVIEKIKKDTKIKLIEYTKTINKNKNTYKFSGKNYEFAKFDAINGIRLKEK